MILMWPGIKKMLDEWFSLLELLFTATEPLQWGEVQVREMVSTSTACPMLPQPQCYPAWIPSH